MTLFLVVTFLLSPLLSPFSPALVSAAEPSEQPTGLTATVSQAKILLSWTDAAGTTAPDYYLILASNKSYDDITAPTDGTPVDNDYDLSDGSGAANVRYSDRYGDERMWWLDLKGGETYYFKIYPYTGLGTAIDYKTDGTIAQAKATVSNGIYGTKYHDINGNGKRDILEMEGGENATIVFVVDVSGSTNDVEYKADTDDGYNPGNLDSASGDNANENQVLDAEIDAVIRSQNRLIALGYGDTARVAVITFSGSGSGTILDMDPDAADTQNFTTPLADTNGNSIYDIEEAVLGLASYGTTYYDQGLQKAIDIFNSGGVNPSESNLIFLSDGEPTKNSDGSIAGPYDDEAATLQAMGVTIFGFVFDYSGVEATGANALKAVQVIDPLARRYKHPDDILPLFDYINHSQNYLEPALDGWTIYQDVNGDDAQDAGDVTTTSITDDTGTSLIDETGYYKFDSVTPGDNYTIREVLKAGWVQISPSSGEHTTTVPNGAIDGLDFGNAKKEGVLEGTVSGTGITVDSRTVFIDENNNGAFETGEPNATTDGSGNYTISGLVPGTYNVRVVLTGNERQVTMNVAYVISGETTTHDIELKNDDTGPTVTSITRGGNEQSTSETTVRFRVNFGEAVQGVDTSDFALRKVSGTVNGTISDVSGSGDLWTVTVSGITGEGELGLNLDDDDSITRYGNSSMLLGGSGEQDHTTGETYIIDKTAPTVTALTRHNPTDETTSADTVTFQVVFDEAVDGVDAADFALTKTGTADGTIGTVSGSGDTWTVEVTSVDGDGTLGLDVKDSGTGITDSAGNDLSGGFTTGETYIVNIPPTVTALTRHNPTDETTSADTVTFQVKFSEAVDGVGKDDFTLAKTGTANGTIGTVSGSGDTWTVEVTSVDGDGTLGLDVKDSGTGITDTAGNDLSGGFTTGETYTIDNTAPTASITRHTPTDETTNEDTVTFQVTFSEAVDGVDKADFSLTMTDSATGEISETTKLNDTTWTVTVGKVDGNGTLGLDVKDSGTGITDSAGNDLSGGFTTGETYTIENTKPTILSITRMDENPTTGSEDVRFLVTFSEDVENVDVGDFALTATGTVTATIDSIVRKTAGISKTWVAQITDIDGEGTLRLDLKDTNDIVDGGFDKGQSYSVVLKDSDGDGIPDNVEDPNGDGDPTNDDTDEDGTPNYLDPDDDGDGIPTKDEDVNGENTSLDDDTDGDGTPNYLDTDDDGDGTLTSEECPDTTACPDEDGNGIEDHLEPSGGADDTDGDGIPNSEEDPNGNGNLMDDDTDGDGIPNYKDDDDDGDEIPTKDECPDSSACTDTDSDTIPDYLEPNTIDTDNDGTPNHQDADDDGDGVPTKDEDPNGNGNPMNDDSDGDSIPNYLDDDDDGDTVPTKDEDPNGDDDPSNDDTDEDGTPNYLDTDDDGDTVPTKDEDPNGDNDPSNDDTDRDGTPNYLDTDDDDDGFATKDEDVNLDGDPTNDDTDSNGTPNYLDTDDDGDGIPTATECPGGVACDTDGDSIPDYLESNTIDTDGDEKYNFDDADDDNDTIPTRDEDANGNGTPLDDDTDGDGIPDYLDNNDDNDCLLTQYEDPDGDGNPLNDDSDFDGVPDYLDPNNGDTDGDGIPNCLDEDDDNDGIPTKDEDINGDGNPHNDDTDGDGIPNYLDSDDDNDTILTKDEDKDGDGDPRNDDTDKDGVPDYLEPNNQNTDGDGKLNYQDDEDDGDGFPTIKEDPDGDGQPINDDTDGDGIPNYLDSDDDNDGIPTATECPDTTACPDEDGDNVPDYLEPNNRDTDGDGTPNYKDEDDDGDGFLTKDEDPDGDGNPINDDTDKDGIPNYLDNDDDNDTILTSKECPDTTACPDEDSDNVPDYLEPNTGDTDVDGTPNHKDEDDDGDGILTKNEDPNGDGNPLNDDTDNDGTPNYLDRDDDGDTIPTKDEDLNGDGDPTNDDSDGDGIPNYLDNDDDNDGTPTRDEDANGNFNPLDDDADKDGIPDYLESNTADPDGDGKPNYQDEDDDGDGVLTKNEDLDGDGNPLNDDTDKDGVPNYLDQDDDGDGVPSKDEDTGGDGNPVNDDTDNDGIPNYLDTDDDGDGIPTKAEDPNGDGSSLNDDTDGDGIPNYLDENDNGDGTGTADQGTDTDTDGDGIPDYLDLDVDGDGISNKDEDADGDGNPADDDTDGDGIPNYLDTDDDGDTIPTAEEDLDGDGNPANDDTDGDGIPNFLDKDDNGDGVPTAEQGKEADDDGDGTLERPDMDEDGTPDYLDNDVDGDGIPNIEESVDGDKDPSDDDTDKDGIPNFLDEDDNGDGIPTAEQGKMVDTDEDGTPDSYPDQDEDGTPDYLDMDVDGDKIPNNEEDLDGDGDLQNDDSDGDGIPNYLDPDDNDDGILTGVQGRIDDTDGDGIPDYLDPDVDGDGIPNKGEDLDGDGSAKNDDTDGDGIPNFLDKDDNGDGIPTEDQSKQIDTDGDGTPDTYPDLDEDGTPDYLDMDIDGDGIPNNLEDINKDGELRDDDSDGDGIPDYLDAVYDAPTLGLEMMCDTEVEAGNTMNCTLIYSNTETITSTTLTVGIDAPDTTVFKRQQSDTRWIASTGNITGANSLGETYVYDYVAEVDGLLPNQSGLIKVAFLVDNSLAIGEELNFYGVVQDRKESKVYAQAMDRAISEVKRNLYIPLVIQN
jgi:Mg-chelatase subunit ChlD